MISLRTIEDTKRIATELARSARPGNCYALYGNLGVGKTVFSRFFVKTLLPSVTFVPSPTFTIIQRYDGQGLEILHMDFYRLKSKNDVLNLGFLEEMPYAISLIEWPEVAEDFLPKSTRKLHFYQENEARFLNITS